MAQSWSEVNKFRLFVLCGLSFLTSVSLQINSEHVTWSGILNTVIQVGIAGFAYLQCPSTGATNILGRKNKPTQYS